jgi:hypothetical protein
MRLFKTGNPQLAGGLSEGAIILNFIIVYLYRDVPLPFIAVSENY